MYTFAFIGLLFAAAQALPEKKQDFDYQSIIEDSVADLPPEAVGFICSALCEDDEGDDETQAAILESLTSLQQEVSSLHAKLSAINQTIASSGAGAESTRPEWKKKYPIYMVESPYGHYMLSQSEAAALCEENGDRQATYIQLLAAFEEGMDWCSCGWLEEGFAAYPIQWPRDGCNKKVGPGVRTHCTWQSTWNGWCIKGDYWA